MSVIPTGIPTMGTGTGLGKGLRGDRGRGRTFAKEGPFVGFTERVREGEEKKERLLIER